MGGNMIGVENLLLVEGYKGYVVKILCVMVLLLDKFVVWLVMYLMV